MDQKEDKSKTVKKLSQKIFATLKSPAILKMDLSQIKWSSKEYSIKEFMAKFQVSFPAIIKITEGFYGKQDVDSISTSTILRVHSLYSQKRAIAKSATRKIFSLPVKMKKMNFIKMDPTAPKDMIKRSALTLESILSVNCLPVTIFPSLNLTFKEKYSSYCEEQKLDVLTIEETYEETFLLGHAIDQGELLIETPIAIPMYMKQINLVMAEGLLDGDVEKWDTLCSILDKQVQNKGNMDHYIFEEILLLDSNGTSRETNLYNEVEPIYIDINPFMEPDFEENANFSNPLEELKSNLKKKALTPPVNPSVTVRNKPRIQQIKDIPKDLHDLSVEEVCDCLFLLNMQRYTEAFQKEQIDGQLLFVLDQDTMHECFGMNSLHIAKLLKFKNGWRPNIQEDKSC